MTIDVKGPIISSSEQWIYDWLGMEATSAKKVRDELKKAKGERVTVEINSGGGEIMAASEIYTALRAYEGEVRIRIVGLAASAASVIAMAAESEMTPTGMMMIHNVQTSTEGDYRAMEHSAEVLRTANRTILNAYREKSGKTEREILDMMDHETWITAQDAVRLGLVDRVMGEQPARGRLTADFGAGMLDAEVLRRVGEIIGGSIGEIRGKEWTQAKLRYEKLKGEQK